MQATHPKRFYKSVTTRPEAGGFAICLDGRIPKTPAKNPIILPTLACANQVSAEWESQNDQVIPATMPLTRLINVAIDHGEATRDAMIEEVIRYSKTDLVCYRTPNPKSLVEAQAAAWDPLMNWAHNTFNVELAITYESIAITQKAKALDALRAQIQTYDKWRLTALAFANGLCGSAIVALALTEGFIDGETAFKAIRVEENWQAARWGTDPDEELVANARRLDLIAIERLVATLADTK